MGRERTPPPMIVAIRLKDPTRRLDGRLLLLLLVVAVVVVVVVCAASSLFWGAEKGGAR